MYKLQEICSRSNTIPQGPIIHDCLPEQHAWLFEIIDHGVLLASTKLCFVLTALTAQYCTVLVSDGSVQAKLLLSYLYLFILLTRRTTS